MFSKAWQLTRFPPDISNNSKKIKMMKTMIKKLLILAVMFGTFSSYTNNVLVDYNITNNEKNNISVVIKDASGTVVYLNTANYKGDAKALFDYSQLENGLYALEIDTKFQIKITPFEVRDYLVEFLDEESQIIYKPVFKKEDANIYISKVGLDNSEMKVELYYENDLIHSEIVSSEKPIIKRAYKLDRSEKGDYAAVMTSNGRVYTERFKL